MTKQLFFKINELESEAQSISRFLKVAPNAIPFLLEPKRINTLILYCKHCGFKHTRHAVNAIIKDMTIYEQEAMALNRKVKVQRILDTGENSSWELWFKANSLYLLQGNFNKYITEINYAYEKISKFKYIDVQKVSVRYAVHHFVCLLLTFLKLIDFEYAHVRRFSDSLELYRVLLSKIHRQR